MRFLPHGGVRLSRRWRRSGRVDDVSDAERFDVDGETFDVSPHARLPGRCQFTWVSGKNPGYGFMATASDGRAMTQAQIVSKIRFFLSQIDPQTGYMAD